MTIKLNVVYKRIISKKNNRVQDVKYTYNSTYIVYILFHLSLFVSFAIVCIYPPFYLLSDNSTKWLTAYVMYINQNQPNGREDLLQPSGFKKNRAHRKSVMLTHALHRRKKVETRKSGFPTHLFQFTNFTVTNKITEALFLVLKSLLVILATGLKN